MATAKTHPALAKIRKSGATKVKVACSDIDGILRGKYLHKDKFEGAADSGFGFCDVVFGWDSGDNVYDNTQVTGWQHGFPDALARLDLGTHRNVPWDGGVDFFLGEFINADGSPYAVCPRQTLKRVLKRAEKLGFQVMTGMEYEWFNFRETPQSWAAKKGVGPETITPGMFGYSLLRVNQNREFFNALMDEMLAFNVPIEGLHTETGPGVYEAAIAFSEALEQADRAILFKTGAKEIGSRFGIMPSFMAKWSAQYPGCSGHVHQSLSDGKANLFYDAKKSRKMSQLFESYLAGQVACLMEFAPMFWPTINSYKRLVDGFWAPVKPTWGIDNRTASFRVIAGSPKATRLETRCPGADVNPYLAMAAVIAAGLYGVEKGLKLTAPPITGTNQGAENIPACAAHAHRNHPQLQQLEDRAGFPGRHLRRTFRGHARLGMAPVARRRDRLGTEALLRNHLMQIRRLTPADASAYRALRLRALWEYPAGLHLELRGGREAPAGGHRQAAGLGAPEVLGRLRRGRTVRHGRDGLRNPRQEPPQGDRRRDVRGPRADGARHRPRARRNAGRRRARLGLELLVLTVTHAESSARRLYERCGFRSFGIEPRAIKVDGHFFAKNHMYLELNAS